MIEAYLKSEQAREDVRTLINTKPMRCVASEPSNFWWVPRSLGAWIQVELQHVPLSGLPSTKNIFVHYRPDGEGRFIVSDLGDGVNKLQLRTGKMNIDAPLVVGEIRKAGAGEWGHLVAALIGTADDLPDTICRVMLASDRVANLSDEARGGQ